MTENHRIFSGICRAAGWKCTSQRLSVYEYLCGNRTHPDVDAVWTAVREKLPTVSRESVYRILNEFSERGIIRRLDHIDSARYDSRTRPHGHLICEQCGTIVDFDLPEDENFSRVRIPGEIRHFELRVVGLCENCARKKRIKTGSPEKKESKATPDNNQGDEK